jgi:hypothetical protein
MYEKLFRLENRVETLTAQLHQPLGRFLSIATRTRSLKDGIEIPVSLAASLTPLLLAREAMERCEQELLDQLSAADWQTDNNDTYGIAFVEYPWPYSENRLLIFDPSAQRSVNSAGPESSIYFTTPDGKTLDDAICNMIAGHMDRIWLPLNVGQKRKDLNGQLSWMAKSERKCTAAIGITDLHNQQVALEQKSFLFEECGTWALRYQIHDEYGSLNGSLSGIGVMTFDAGTIWPLIPLPAKRPVYLSLVSYPAGRPPCYEMRA